MTYIRATTRRSRADTVANELREIGPNCSPETGCDRPPIVHGQTVSEAAHLIAAAPRARSQDISFLYVGAHAFVRVSRVPTRV